jgi:hypothetical protein
MTKIEKRTILRAKDFENNNGNVTVRLALVVIEGGAVLGSRTHTQTIGPEHDVDTVLDGVTNNLAALDVRFPEMLKGLGLDESDQTVSYPPVSKEDRATISAAVQAARTPEVMARFEEEQRLVRERIEREAAEREAEAARQQAAQAEFEEAQAQRIAARALEIAGGH